MFRQGKALGNTLCIAKGFNEAWAEISLPKPVRVRFPPARACRCAALPVQSTINTIAFVPTDCKRSRRDRYVCAVREKTQRFIPSGAVRQLPLRNKGSQGCGGSRGAGRRYVQRFPEAGMIWYDNYRGTHNVLKKSIFSIYLA